MWGTSTTIFIAMFVCFFEKANKVTMLGIILFNLIMLWSGHKILPKLSKRKFYDRKLFKYSRMYIDYPSHEEYRMQIEQSIRRGVLSHTGFWMLTDEFMLGRLGDITFEPVAIP